MAQVVEVEDGKAAVARAVLMDLPEWFGRPESLDAYVRAADTLPMLALQLPDGRRIGFLSVKPHTSVTAEAYVLGVMRQWHRQGLGRSLFAAAERRLAADGFRYLTVKTLSADHPDRHYAATRRFYEAMGFDPIEVFADLWGTETPCLLMLKCLGEPAAPRRR
jgi:ribosomal protein S18 acetylase RimI-like enzyme